MEIFRRKFSRPGKSALVLAGLHGNQYTSVYCLRLFRDFVERGGGQTLGLGEAVLVNFVNLSGIQLFARLTQSGVDLNREFGPGRASCPEAARIKRMVLDADVVVDMHSSFGSMAFCCLDQDEYLAFYRKFLRDAGVPSAVAGPGNPTVKKFANGFPSKLGFTLQLNQSGTEIDAESAETGLNFLKRILRASAGAEKVPGPRGGIPASFQVCSDYFGLMELRVSPGDRISAGRTLGRVTSIDGKRRNEIVSPSDGTVIAAPKRMSYVTPGQPVLMIQP